MLNTNNKNVFTIKKRISRNTKAIIVVDLFGYPAQMDEIMEIASDNDLIVIEDAAQAPGAKYKGKYAGTIGHIGVFSLNYHKTIHSGEGGVVVTNDDFFAERVQLIRNHAEAVVKKKNTKNIVNMIGFNYRMTEIEAVIAIEQLKKLPLLLKERANNASFIIKELIDIQGLIFQNLEKYVKHGYYVLPIRYNSIKNNKSRRFFIDAMKAEGITLGEGYVEPIYLQPVYQKRIAFGKDGYPFTYSRYNGSVSYQKGICPIAEKMHYEELITFTDFHSGVTESDLDDVINAFKKVFFYESKR